MTTHNLPRYFTTLTAGNTYNQVASDVISGHADKDGNFVASGDVDITAKDINVQGNTDLKGGAIVSVAPSELNTLNTGSLTYSDIQNHAEYEASSSSMGTSFNAGFSDIAKNTLLSQAPQALNGGKEASSTTHATLSPSTVTINGEAATNEQLSGLATKQTDSSIAPIFDKQEVLDDMALSSTLADVVTLGSNVIATQLKRDDYVARDQAIADAEAALWVNSYLYGDGSTYDDYAENPSVNALLDIEFNTALQSDPNLQAEYDKYKANLKEGETDTFMNDYINKGNSFGTLSSQEASWHQTQLSYGPGSSFDMATQAIRGATSALAMGNTDQALANLTQPYIANQIGQYFDDPNNTNEAARALAHAALGAAVAYLSGNDALSGALGAVSGEVIAKEAMDILYPGKTPDELTLEEKENIRAVATLASGLVGAATGGSFEDSATAAAAGYNAAVNNVTHVVADQTANEARKTGANVVVVQKNKNDPESFFVMSPDQAALLIALGDDKDKLNINANAGFAGAIHVLFVGLNAHYDVLSDTKTACVRLGLGLYFGGGVEVGGTIGKSSNATIGLGGDLAFGFEGVGGSLATNGSSLSGGISVKPGFGLGASGGVDGCVSW